jgi:hypothetical protein
MLGGFLEVKVEILVILVNTVVVLGPIRLRLSKVYRRTGFGLAVNVDISFNLQ